MQSKSWLPTGMPPPPRQRTDEDNESEHSHSSSSDDDSESESASKKHPMHRRRPRDERSDGGDSSGSEVDEERETVATLSCALSEALVHDVKSARLGVRPRDNEEEADALSNPKKKDEVCCICGDKAEYTCPGCKRRTCSLTCVRAHKTTHTCSGERNVTGQVPLHQFDDAQLRRDFHFLEDCRRVVDGAVTHRPKDTWHFTFAALPPPLHALREAGKIRGLIIQFMSEGMKKREDNTTRYDRRSDTISWRCEFRFINNVDDHLRPSKQRASSSSAVSSQRNFTVATNWANERFLLGDILEHCSEMNPTLPLYHIRRGYSRASKWIRGGELQARTKRDREEADEPPKLMESTPEISAELMSQKSEGGKNVVCIEDGDDEADQHHAQHHHAALHVPLTTEQMIAASNVARFLQENTETGYSILYRAERLGDRLLYFSMNPCATLHENLRTVFFVNEFPIFYVVKDEDLLHFELVGDADKESIRESFRKKEKPTLEQKIAALPKRSELEPSLADAYSKIPCRQYIRGMCTREECPYWHCEASQVPACRNMVNSGECPKGVRCSFQHDPEIVAAAKAQQQSRPFGGRGRGGGRGGYGGGRGGRGGGDGTGRVVEGIRLPEERSAQSHALRQPIHIPMATPLSYESGSSGVPPPSGVPSVHGYPQPPQYYGSY